MNNDFVDEIADYIHTLEFNGSEADSSTFTFGWRNDDNGHIDVGIGSNEKPFVVGVTFKRATFAAGPAGRFVYRCQSFHLAALFVTSQGLETQYTDMLNALRLMYFRIMQKSLTVYYVMGDAEDAQYKAIQNTFGSDNTIRILMYYFHVISNVLKRKKVWNLTLLVRYIHMHFSRSPQECATLVQAQVAEWKTSPAMKAFADYSVEQWLKGNFFRWQCFQTPRGFASTNNPVEQFNKTINTLRQKLKMGTLLQQLVSCCQNESCDFKFKTDIEVPKAVKLRANSLAEQNILLVTETPNETQAASHMRYMVDAPRNKTVEAIEVCAQMNLNYARMERKGQPQSGWKVVLIQRCCGCDYFFKFDYCIHLLHALKISEPDMQVGKPTLVYRGISKKRQRSLHSIEPRVPEGRPRTNGFALDME
ncbi:hypothetical protein PHMEG_00030924 [Phytophthora megakarya]|uniref:MULE transposase domain-containing protein n=1 Tax=Phytophthora megakarya TaxID=4795 RepID=A0A225UZD7_9STRA|nr:hypothetical protein PHMEG_00030924 [Phytophthora megakarya]